MEIDYKNGIQDYDYNDESKHELSIDYCMIVGNYLKTDKDMINFIKVRKNLKQLPGMYHNNPTPSFDLYPLTDKNTRNIYIDNSRQIDNGKVFNDYKKGVYNYNFCYDMDYEHAKKLLNEINDKKSSDNFNYKIKGNVIFHDTFINHKDIPNDWIELDNINKVITINIPDYITILNYEYFNVHDPNFYAHSYSIKFPNKLKEIGDTFTVEKVQNLVFPNSLTKIGDYCFNEVFDDYDPNLFLNIKFPLYLKSIGIGSFYSINCKDLIIPDGITRINDYCFQYCSNLTNLILPNSLKEIGKGCFIRTKLKSFYFPSNIIKMDEKSFGDLRFIKFSYQLFLTCYNNFILKKSFTITNVDSYDKVIKIKSLLNYTSIELTGGNLVIKFI